jgi:hypothetical protein
MGVLRSGWAVLSNVPYLLLQCQPWAIGAEICSGTKIAFAFSESKAYHSSTNTVEPDEELVQFLRQSDPTTNNKQHTTCL